MREINVCGMSCPEPVVRTQNELKVMKNGDKLRVITDSETARENISRLATSKKCKLDVKKENDCYCLEIEF